MPWFDIPEDDRSPAEKEWLAVGAAYAAREFDYMKLQANKTMMPAVALADSPIGAAAWIAEKFWAWSDNGGDLDKIIPMDTLITNIMLYLVGPGAHRRKSLVLPRFPRRDGLEFLPGIHQHADGYLDLSAGLSRLEPAFGDGQARLQCGALRCHAVWRPFRFARAAEAPFGGNPRGVPADSCLKAPVRCSGGSVVLRRLLPPAHLPRFQSSAQILRLNRKPRDEFSRQNK